MPIKTIKTMGYRVDIFFDLEDDELKQLFSLSKPYSSRVRKIIRDELDVANTESEAELGVLRDEAFGHYWKRYIDKKPILKEKDIEKLLINTMFPTSKSLLGEAIINNKVDIVSCEKILEKSESTSWLYRQAKSYVLVSNINKGSVHENLLNLLNLRCTWALYRLIDSTDQKGLEYLTKILENDNPLPKKEVNRLIDRVRSQKKLRAI